MTDHAARNREKSSNTGAGHCFGAHLSIAGGVQHAIEAALRLRLDTVQVFVKNQRQWRAPPLKDDDVTRWHELARTPGFGPTVAHATYLINLASADEALRRKSCAAFAEELRRCDTLGIPYLVVHPGAAGEAHVSAALRRVARSLDDVLPRHGDLTVMPLLETTAGQGTALGRRFEELGEILAQVHAPQRVGVCIDTCHVFAAGYDLRDPEAYAAMVASATASVGLERVRCWHFNDSVGELGSRRDRHAHIGHGCIGMAGFRRVLADKRFRGVPMILETPKGEDERGRDWDKVNVRRLRAMAARVG